jgi:hypothetical protein
MGSRFFDRRVSLCYDVNEVDAFVKAVRSWEAKQTAD